MKKLSVIFLSFLIAICFAGCVKAPSGENVGGNEKPPVSDDSGQSNGSPFTVSLVYEDNPFGVYPEDGTTAIWTSKEDGSVKEVAFDTKGVATAEGLDGDYTVTVHSLADGYAYNPNIYTATNDAKNVEIKVFRLLKANGAGTGWYSDDIKVIPKAGGIYRFTLTSASQEIYCRYNPPDSGEYFIESLCDITANEINPRMEVHEANHGYVNEDRIKEMVNFTEDAPRSVFTKNFRYRISAYSTTFSCAFKLTCDSRVGYPVNVDLYVVRASDYEFGEDVEYPLYIPKEDFKQTPEYTSEFRYIAEDDPNGVLRGERVGFNEDDGYYHLLGEGGKPDGAVLYAKLKGAIIAPNGSALVNFQTMAGVSTGEGGTERGLNLYFGGWNYTFLIQGYQGLVSSEYSDAENYKDEKSYVDYLNSDGVYAVTRELKDFLQLYSEHNYFFYDGYGWAEGLGYNSNDANQWLFACGYYA